MRSWTTRRRWWDIDWPRRRRGRATEARSRRCAWRWRRWMLRPRGRNLRTTIVFLIHAPLARSRRVRLPFSLDWMWSCRCRIGVINDGLVRDLAVRLALTFNLWRRQGRNRRLGSHRSISERMVRSCVGSSARVMCSLLRSRRGGLFLPSPFDGDLAMGFHCTDKKIPNFEVFMLGKQSPRDVLGKPLFLIVRIVNRHIQGSGLETLKFLIGVGKNHQCSPPLKSLWS